MHAQATLAGRRHPLAQIATSDLDVTVISQLPAAQLPFGDHLEAGALQVERFHAPLGRRRLIEEMLEDPAGDPHRPFVEAEDHAELDGVAFVIPAGVFWELEEQHACDLRGEGAAVPTMF